MDERIKEKIVLLEERESVIEALKGANRAKEELILSVIDDVIELKKRIAGLERTNEKLVRVMRRRKAMIDQLVGAEMKKKFIEKECGNGDRPLRVRL